jgi:hypothetical protein
MYFVKTSKPGNSFVISHAISKQLFLPDTLNAITMRKSYWQDFSTMHHNFV